MLSLAPAQGEKVWLWTVRTYDGSQWTREVLPGWLRSHRLPVSPRRVIVTAVSRTGVDGAAATITP